jgi:hypothetical protein
MTPARQPSTPAGAHHDVLTEHDVGPGETLEEPVVDHRLGAGSDLLGRLEDGEQRPPPSPAVPAEQRCRARQPGDVHVVAAGVHHRDGLAVLVRRCGRAGVGQPRQLLDRQSVHVRAQHDGGAVAIAQQPDDARLPDPRRHVVAGGTQPLRGDPRRAGLLHRELGVRVDIGVELLQLRKQRVEGGEQLAHGGRVCHGFLTPFREPAAVCERLLSGRA